MFRDSYNKMKNVTKGFDDSLLEVITNTLAFLIYCRLMKKKYRINTMNFMMMFFQNGKNSERLCNLK